MAMRVIVLLLVTASKSAHAAFEPRRKLHWPSAKASTDPHDEHDNDRHNYEHDEQDTYHDNYEHGVRHDEHGHDKHRHDNVDNYRDSQHNEYGYDEHGHDEHGYEEHGHGHDKHRDNDLDQLDGDVDVEDRVNQHHRHHLDNNAMPGRAELVKESSSSPVIVKASKEKKDEPEVKKAEEVTAAPSPPRQKSPLAQKEEAIKEPVKEIEESPKKESKEEDVGMVQEDKAETKSAEAAKAAPAGDDREERLQRFAKESHLIPQAMEALRNLKPDLQDKIMEEGPIKPGCNPIIVLMNRIKESKDVQMHSVLRESWQQVLLTGERLRAAADAERARRLEEERLRDEAEQQRILV
ncbi:unnamed protein product [Symbiodinium natans]|uniref:Uncharacterized protein n=1 Tax=Symbiodinium natans TaxID=878477 RepID=A0A812G397_9DINO|nr:unnamed protein product [Symbiodinium natans]